jgi:hypothetical protein
MLWNLLTSFFALGSIRDCSDGLGRAVVVGFDSLPTNPVGGDNVSLWVAYDLPEPPITGGIARYAYALNGIPFPASEYDLCTQTKCPKEVGFNNESSSSIFPSGISGKIVSSISWTDQNDELVWCVETTWRV